MKKILMVNEFSYLSTGYSTYGREVLTRLHDAGYHVAEFATYVHHEDRRLQHVPWDVYCNLPGPNDPPELRQKYQSVGTNVFGEWRFEEVCLNFRPDIVFDIRDFWMLEFQSRSPFRPFFKWAIMPTVDSWPQNDQWVSVYQDADAVLTYSDWSGEVLENQSDQINWLGSASPAAHECYKPMSLQERQQARVAMGLKPDTKVVGTVMRNQRRKLYPELFRAFRRYIDETGDDNIVLYCHTSYPDRGWDIPELLKTYGLGDKVYFTHVCAACQNVTPSLFKGARSHCSRCGSFSCGLTNVQRGVDPETLARIVGMFDFYVQYANSEGFGMPQVEAGACGVPIASTDFSAMADVVRKLEGYPIPTCILYKELETGCQRAYPDEASFVGILKDYFSLPTAMRERKRLQTRQAFERHYSWDVTAQKWMSVFDDLECPPQEQTWLSQPRFFRPADWNEEYAQKMNNRQYADWLFHNVLGEPERLHTQMHTRMLRDLNYEVHLDGIAGQYYNEQSQLFNQAQYQPFDRKMAYDMMLNLCNRRNHWEMVRKNTLL